MTSKSFLVVGIFFLTVVLCVESYAGDGFITKKAVFHKIERTIDEIERRKERLMMIHDDGGDFSVGAKAIGSEILFELYEKKRDNIEKELLLMFQFQEKLERLRNSLKVKYKELNIPILDWKVDIDSIYSWLHQRIELILEESELIDLEIDYQVYVNYIFYHSPFQEKDDGVYGRMVYDLE